MRLGAKSEPDVSYKAFPPCIICAQYRGDIMSTVGDVQYFGGIMINVWDILSTVI